MAGLIKKKRNRLKNSWFKPQGFGYKTDKIWICWIKVNAGKPRVVISVPGVCGNAVHRNRFRRMVRENLRGLLQTAAPGEGLWIRLPRSAILKRETLLLKDWKKILDAAADLLDKQRPKPIEKS